MLQTSQTFHGRVIGRVDAKMEPAEAFDGQHKALPDQSGRFGKRSRVSGEGPSVPVPKFRMRPAIMAGVRLGMIAPVRGVFVLRQAGGAHREIFHRGPRPVVGERLKNAVTRAAMRAIGERITVAAVRGGKDLAQTFRAGGNIRHHER